jgi:polyisoprenoid-binding protein YceI
MPAAPDLAGRLRKVIRVSRFLACLICVALAATPADAAEWIVDTAASSIRFNVMASGWAVKGTFKRFAAKVDFDPANPEAGSAAVDIDMVSASIGDATMDRTLASAEWFDVPRSPAAQFACRGFRKSGEGYACDGSLTIRGVAVPVTLPFSFAESGGSASVRGTATVDRRKWPIGASFKDEASVAFTVTITIAVKATRK